MEHPVALITGGSKGIGESIVKLFAQKRCQIAFTYNTSKDRAESIVKSLSSLGACKAYPLNFNDTQSSEKLAERVVNDFGRLDFLVNNAGNIPKPSDWGHITETQWIETLYENLIGHFFVIRGAIPYLRSHTSPGRIVNISSAYGCIGASPVVAYTAAKAGLINLTKSMAKELAPEICINCVAPAHVSTDMFMQSDAEFISSIEAQIPMGNISSPEEVASMVFHLCSEHCKNITGQTITIDGGYTL